MTKLILQEKKDDLLIVKNVDIRICIICGNDQIESYEFGLSCEECGTLMRR